MPYDEEALKKAKADQEKLTNFNPGTVNKYKCPKCGGADYFMSTRTVMKGIGGIWGNRGGTKKFPVCKVCDEIMEEEIRWA